MKTKTDLEYNCAPYGLIAIIPKGTPCKLVTNLPNDGYWAEPWPGMSKRAESWQRNYGFLLSKDEVEE